MKIGIIGGSGLEKQEMLEDFREIPLTTKYGSPSSPLVTGKISSIELAFLSRHGKNHEIPPTQVNNRANIIALKEYGCNHIISTTAVGSLREKIKRGDFVVPDDFIDFTKKRHVTFHDTFDSGPVHTSLAEPFSKLIREKLIDSCRTLGFRYHGAGTVITIEGPRFSTPAESHMFRKWGADIINMSIAPEAILAKEADLEYATIAMSTDYDCWKKDEAPVTWEQIKEIMHDNSQRVQQVLIKTIESFQKK